MIRMKKLCAVFYLSVSTMMVFAQGKLKFWDNIELTIDSNKIKMDYTITIYNCDTVGYNYYYNLDGDSLGKRILLFEGTGSSSILDLKLIGEDFTSSTTCKYVKLPPNESMTLIFRNSKGFSFVNSDFSDLKNWYKRKYLFRLNGIHLYNENILSFQEAQKFFSPFRGVVKDFPDAKYIAVGNSWTLEFLKKKKKIFSIINKT